MTNAQAGDCVRIHYRVRRENGDTVDISPDDEPLEVVLGVGRYLRGIEAAVVGMAPGEQKSLTIAAADAFGEINEEWIQEVSLDVFPPNDPPTVGRRYRMGDPENGGLLLTVVAVDGEQVVVDGNHPLAGEPLLVEVALMEILPQE